MFPALDLPKAKLKLVRKDEQVFVWCIIRKKNLVLTPEEWVRQHVIHFLISSKNYPIGLISIEMSIEVNGLTRRCDAVVYGKDGQPRLIIECKAPEIALNEHVFHQIAQYNFKLNVDYLLMTNGLNHIVCQIDRLQNSINYLKDIPAWSIIQG